MGFVWAVEPGAGYFKNRIPHEFQWKPRLIRNGDSMPRDPLAEIRLDRLDKLVDEAFSIDSLYDGHV